MNQNWKRPPLQASGILIFRSLRDFLITIGMLIQWPTLVTVAMWPVLMFMYYRLARREEREMESRFGNQYAVYRRQVPMFWPRLGAAPLTNEVETGWRQK